MPKEKLTSLGEDWREELKKFKEKSIDPKLSKEWDEINYKGLSQKEINKHKEKMLSKMSDKERASFERKDALRKKAKNQYETQAKNLKEVKNEGKIIKKDKKIKKVSEKLISEDFFGKSMSITKPKEEKDERTISIAADKNIAIKKVSENKNLKNKEKKPKGKTEIIGKILELKTELIGGKDLEESEDISKHLLKTFFDDTELVEYANENLEKINQIKELMKQLNNI